MKRLLETRAEQFRAIVTTGASTTVFSVVGLAGFGDDYYNDEWWVQVVQADAAAPEHEWREITDYVSDTGTFTVSPAFSQNIDVGDELLFIHEYQHGIGARDDAALGTTADDDGDQSLIALNRGEVDRIGNVDDAATADDMSDIASTNALAKLRLILNRLSTNAFTAPIQGGARTELDTMMAQMATYFVASGGAFADKVNNKTLRTNLEDILQDFFLTVGCAGTSEFKTTIQAAAATQTSIEAAFDALATYFVASGAAMTTSINGTARANIDLVFGDLADILWGGNGIAVYPAAANIGHGVSIAESIRAILTSVVGGDDYDAYTNISNTANASLNAVAQKFATVIGIEAAQTYGPTVNNVTQTTIEGTHDALDDILVGAGIASFPAAADIADGVPLAAAVRAVLKSMMGDDDYDGWTNINGTANASLDAALQNVAKVLGADAANVFNPTIDGAARTDLDAALKALWDGLQNGGVKNTMINRDMPYLTEFWETEALNANKWQEVIDGLGTGAFAVDDGYMFYDLDTENAVNSDVLLNSKYRWQARPATFSDTNTSIEKLILEFEVKVTGTLTDIVNANFVLGLAETKDNDNTDNNLAVFTLVTDALTARTDNDGAADDDTTITGITLTNWNKFKIEVYATGYKFYVNETLEATHTTAIPDEAMYIVFGNRCDGVGAGAVGLNVANVRAWYEEVV